MIGSAEIGEIMMRAFILRRVGLLEEGGVGSVLIGNPGTPDLVRLEGFLGRNGYPCTVLDAFKDPEARAVIEQSGVLPEELPVMLCPNGTLLRRPTDAEAGACLGITPELDPDTVFEEEVALVGGGNSAGQAVVFLAPKVKHLHLVVRGEGLEASMSQYLIDRIAMLRNVELHTHTEVVGLEGDQANGLTGATFRDRRTGTTRTCPVRHLFLFIGADPNAGWLEDCVSVDDKGFVVTGADFADDAGRRGGRPCRSRQVGQACSRSAMCEPARPSALPRQLAKAPP
jgi:hypothetical protein